MKEKITQTAGREQLGEFAPLFARLNDDVLFGQVWNEGATDIKTKCIITVVALMSSGITDYSLVYHLQNAKAHGVSKEEIAEIITHVGMYVGWPKAWAVFRLAKDVWNEEAAAADAKGKYQSSIFFPIGAPNDASGTISSGKAILPRCQRRRSPFIMSPLNPAAVIIGTSTGQKTAGDRCLSAWAAEAFISNGAKSPLKCFPER